MNAQAVRRRFHIPPQSGVAFEVDAGDVIRVIDPTGEQVSDLVAFAWDDADEWLSSGRSIDYQNTIWLTAGHVLYSNRSNPMLTIARDDVGRHDFLLAPCSERMFELLHGEQRSRAEARRPSCLGNLAKALADYGISQDQVPTAFNIFMNVIVRDDGSIVMGPPLSKAGDAIELRAEMRLIVAATACSSEWTNNGRCKPIDIEIVHP